MRHGIAGTLLAVLAAAAAWPSTVGAQALPNHYGAPVSTEVARKVAVAALAEARKNGWTMAAAVVDTGGTLVYFERIDGTQNGSSEIALEKARTSAMFKRPSKAIADVVASGKLNYLRLSGSIPLEGGQPLIVDGKIVGAVGVSGGSAEQDGTCARAGADVLAVPAAPTKK